VTKYRDPGTLIFLAPEGVGAAEKTASARRLKTANSLLLVHETTENGDLDVIPVAILSIDADPNRATMCIKPEAGTPMFPGNSGGGVWLNGALVGNLWEVEYKFEQCPGSDNPPPHWEQEVIKGIAALLPGEMTPGL
jgi:hypothetical protein